MTIQRRVFSLFLIALAAAGPTLAGCGGGSDKMNVQPAEGGEAEESQADALDKIPEADRTAFFQLATAIGALRARAAPVAVGTSSHLTSSAPLISARGQLARLRPADKDLVRLRDRLVSVLTSFARAPTSGAASRQSARAAISRADRIEAGLRAYTRRTPAIAGAIPD